MAHVRKGKTAKRNRRLGALERLRADLERSDRLVEGYAIRDRQPSRLHIIFRIRIKSEIAALESRI